MIDVRISAILVSVILEFLSDLTVQEESLSTQTQSSSRIRPADLLYIRVRSFKVSNWNWFHVLRIDWREKNKNLPRVTSSTILVLFSPYLRARQWLCLFQRLLMVKTHHSRCVTPVSSKILILYDCRAVISAISGSDQTPRSEYLPVKFLRSCNWPPKYFDIDKFIRMYRAKSRRSFHALWFLQLYSWSFHITVFICYCATARPSSSGLPGMSYVSFIAVEWPSW